jgi:hypothetical protein
MSSLEKSQTKRALSSLARPFRAGDLLFLVFSVHPQKSRSPAPQVKVSYTNEYRGGARDDSL